MGFRGICGFIAFFLFHNIAIAQSEVESKYQCSTDASAITISF